jgi:hypothetical protein
MFQPMPKEKYKQAGSGPRRFNTLHRILLSKKWILATFVAGMALASLTGPDQVIAQISDLGADRILEDDTQHPWVLEADEIAYDRRLDQYRARGNVKISKGDKQLTADFIRFDHKTMQAGGFHRRCPFVPKGKQFSYHGAYDSENRRRHLPH